MNLLYDYEVRERLFPYLRGANPAKDLKDRGLSWRGVTTCTNDALRFVDVSGDTSDLPGYLIIEK